MATLTASPTYAAQVSAPQNRLPDGFPLNRELRRFVETYTFDAAAAADDTFPLVVLPQGGNVKLIPHLSRVSHQGAGTTLTLSLIDSAGNVLCAAVNALTANGIAFSSENMEVEVPDDGIIRVKLATEDAVVATDVLQFLLVFVQE